MYDLQALLARADRAEAEPWNRQPQHQMEGNGFYSACACWSAAPINAQWYGVLTAGCYWSSVYGLFWVGGVIYQHYMGRQAECGYLGLPLSERVAGDAGTYVQYFIPPGSNDLRFIIEGPAPDRVCTDYVIYDYFG